MSAPYDSYDYQSYWHGRKFEDKCERLCLEKMLNLVPQKGLIVDIGGGFGRLSTLYSSYFDQCLVIDPSEKLLFQGQKLAKNYANVAFKQGSLPNLPLKSETVDVAIMVRVSHHIPDLSPSLTDVYRILKKDGYFILEIANKIHFLARIKAWLRGDFSFGRNLEPVERRSKESIREGLIAFSNHHPDKVIKDLKDIGFCVKEIYSVSNFRSTLIKTIFPEKMLVALEGFLQRFFARLYFGPSVFILAQKE
ncbi:MAG: class I SAM-dependent methyltransferase [Patescibacteria group bacterium]|jgi:ubiquinone/menaquinone biosynthesis C-methylase UbiE